MSMGLDLGTSVFRSVRTQGRELRARRFPASYVIVGDDSAHRQRLSRTDAIFVPCGDQLVVLGDAAVELARSKSLPLYPVLPGGKLDTRDALSRQIMAAMVDAILPEAKTPGEICCLTVPSARIAETPEAIVGQKFLEQGFTGDWPELDYCCQLVKLRGYQPLALGQALAVTLAELVGESFCGITAVFGASVTEFAVAHQGRELARVVIPRGGDWIDEQLAAMTHSMPARSESTGGVDRSDHGARYALSLQKARHDREQASRAPSADGQAVMMVEGRYADLYRQFLLAVLSEAGRRLNEVPALANFPQPTIMAYAGGLSRASGFPTMLKNAMRQIDWPIGIESYRSAELSPFGVARGCLIHAALEELSVQRPAA
jgi:hypothetical protein